MTYTEREITYLSPDYKPVMYETPAPLSRGANNNKTKSVIKLEKLEDLKASTTREQQKCRNCKRKIELADQKTECLQSEHDRLVQKLAKLSSEVRILKSTEEDNQWLCTTNKNLKEIIDRLNDR